MITAAQQTFTIMRLPDGTLKTEVFRNGTRRKIETKYGLEIAIHAELDRIETENQEREITKARIEGEARAAQHARIVAHATEKNPTTLQYIEPGKTRREHAKSILAHRNSSYSPAALDELERTGALGRNTRPKDWVGTGGQELGI